MAMDFAAPFKSEVFRPLMLLVVPGSTAVAPFALILRHQEPVVSGFLERHPFVGIAVLIIAALAAGFVLEDLGSFVEMKWDDKLEEANPGHKKAWKDYLMLSLPTNPIGQRYLRRVLLRMHFELHFSIALVVSWLGWFWLEIIHSHWSGVGFVVFSGLALTLAAYLL